MNESDVVPETGMSAEDARKTLESHSWCAWGQGGPHDDDVKLAKATLALAELRKGVETTSSEGHGGIPSSSYPVEALTGQSFAVHLARLANSISAGDLVHQSGGLIIRPLGDDCVVVEGSATLKRRLSR